jgi:hypothetical protein
VKPQVIQRWPGPVEVANKVPTAVGYSAGHKGIISWGFECSACEDLDTGIAVKERFKFSLDPEVLEDRLRDRPTSKVWTHGDVEMWFVDFLSALHNHIVVEIIRRLELTDWLFTTVHYVFSVPTVWEGTAVAKAFEQVVKKAGFGEAADHCIEVNYTEAEAAAIYTAWNAKNQQHVHSGGDYRADGRLSSEGLSLQQGDILLVCDSGGGTTVILSWQIPKLRSLAG